MQIEFWGVRGSIASPGPDTAAVGGNTSCVALRCGASNIILDAGTGLRGLGDARLAELRGVPFEATLLLSHLHWDHIQGIPFFVPAYVPSTRLTVMGATGGVMSLEETLMHQMQAPVFPVRLDELRAELTLREVRAGVPFAAGEATVRSAKLNHPGGVQAYRIDHGGRSVVYATDTEHYECVDPALVALAQGADVLIYDSQYTPEEYRGEAGPSKVGWGHSTFAAGAEVACRAGVGELVLFHHDPRRTDAGVAALEERAQKLFPRSVAAREGMTITLGPPSASRPAARPQEAAR
jgi:phosphoribosyl 1,2-cyclic phosphodiesterase